VLGGMRVDDSHPDAEFLFGDSDGDSQVGVVGDDYGDVAGVLEGVEDKMRRQVHIRPFLLGSHHFGRAWSPSRWIGKRHSDGVGERFKDASDSRRVL